MMSSSSAKKRKLLEYEESDDPVSDINNALDFVLKGIDLAVSGFSRIQSVRQDELSSIAMDLRRNCIESLNEYRCHIKQIVEEDLKEMTELLEESRLRTDEMKLHDLHEDILNTLFQYLPLKEILKLRLLSVRTHHVITSLISKRVRWNICLRQIISPVHYMSR